MSLLQGFVSRKHEKKKVGENRRYVAIFHDTFFLNVVDSFPSHFQFELPVGYL